jgi:hypothetical protein
MAGAARYRPLRGPARALQQLLAIFVLVTLASLVADSIELGLLTRLLHEGSSGLTAEAATADGRQALVDLLQAAVYVATAIPFLVWFHRAYANLPALGMAPLEVGAGWAIGGWFVPLLNLVRPKEIMNDIWRGSDPDRASRLDGFWRVGPVSGLVHLWWTLVLLSWLVDRIVFAVIRIGPQTVASLRTSTMVSLTADVLDVALGLVALELVRRTSRRQQARADRLAAGELDVLVLFWDPLEPQPHDPDVKALLRIAVLWDIAVACNRTSADFVISSPLMAGSLPRRQPGAA